MSGTPYFSIILFVTKYLERDVKSVQTYATNKLIYMLMNFKLGNIPFFVFSTKNDLHDLWASGRLIVSCIDVEAEVNR